MPFFMCGLSGLAIILVAYKSYILFAIVALVALTMCVCDFILLVRFMASGKYRTFDKPQRVKLFECLKENEITFKLWNKLKRK